MTSKHLLILLFSLFMCCNIAPDKGEVSSKQAADTTYLSLYFIRKDEVNKTREGEILIFGKYAAGKYLPVTDYDTITGQPVSERKLILVSHKSFTTYYKGKILSNILIEKVDSSDYDCDKITIGKCNDKITSALFQNRAKEYSQAREGISEGKDIQYSLINFLALSSNVVQPKNIFSKTQSLDSMQSSLINEHFKAKFKSYCDSLSSSMVVDRSFTSQINFKGKSSPLFVSIATCSDTTKSLFMSLLYIFRMEKGKIEPLFEKFENVGMDSWGSGYAFIDAVDIDSDNNPELIFRVDGYEWSNLVIYKYSNGKFNLVLDTSLYGC